MPFDTAPYDGDPFNETPASKKPILLPAFKDGEKLVVGGIGDTHQNLNDGKEVPESGRVFVSPEDLTKPLNREEAAAYAKAKGVDLGDKPLHSETLWKHYDTPLKPPTAPYEGDPFDEKPPPSERMSAQQVLGKGVNQVFSDITEKTKGAWDTLISDAKRTKPQFAGVPDDLWSYAKRDFDRLVAMGKLPVDAFNLVTAPIEGALKGVIARPLAEGMSRLAPEGAKMDPEEALGIVGMAKPGKAGPATNALNAINPVFQKARDLGLAVTPSEAKLYGGKVGGITNALEWISGGKTEQSQAAAIQNAPKLNALAAKELGLPEDTFLDKMVYKKVRDDAGQAFVRQMEALKALPGGKIKTDPEFLAEVDAIGARTAAKRGEFATSRNNELEKLKDDLRLVIDGDSALPRVDISPEAITKKIEELRHESKNKLDNLGNPQSEDLSRAKREAANALENLIDRQLSAAGNAGIVADVRKARATIEKAHILENATDGAGNVSISDVASQEKQSPFTGGLRDMADLAETFKGSTRSPASFGGLSGRHGAFDIGMLITGYEAMTHGYPVIGAIMGSRPIARTMARNMLLSEAIQNRLAGLRAQTNLGQVAGGANALATFTQGNAPLQQPPQQ